MARLLGVGTFGEVWEAKAPGGFRAAVKLIRKRGSQAEVLVTRAVASPAARTAGASPRPALVDPNRGSHVHVGPR